ncbi:MAG: ankyrin repeat domain-containing protein [Coxiellaceae bacterium]|nr:ankyrin repeat domain-containing protein [Coxiellaceae bacterium]
MRVRGVVYTRIINELYGIELGGVCFGLSSAYANAILCQQTDQFFQRLRFIEQCIDDRVDIAAATQGVHQYLQATEAEMAMSSDERQLCIASRLESLSSDQRMFLEVSALFEQIAMQHGPGNFEGIFPGAFNQHFYRYHPESSPLLLQRFNAASDMSQDGAGKWVGAVDLRAKDGKIVSPYNYASEDVAVTITPTSEVIVEAKPDFIGNTTIDYELDSVDATGKSGKIYGQLMVYISTDETTGHQKCVVDQQNVAPQRVHSSSIALTKHQLTEYLGRIKALLFKKNVAIKFNSMSHQSALALHPGTNQWQYLNGGVTNLSELDSSDSDTAIKLFQSFGYATQAPSDTDHVLLGLEIIGLEKDNELDSAIKALNIEFGVDKVGVEVRGHEKNSTLLHIAASSADYDLISALVGNGYDINTEDDDHNTVLSMAVQRADLHMLRLAISLGAKLKNPDPRVNAAVAIYSHFNEGAKVLFEDLGADINSSFTDDGDGAIVIACGAGNLDILPYLIERGADIYAVFDGNTILNHCIKRNQFDMVKILTCSAAFDACHQAGDNESPIFTALEAGQESIVMYLLAHHAVDMNSENRFNQTLLSVAIEKEMMTVVEKLLAMGANTEGALTEAIRSDNPELLDLLMRCEKIDVNAPNAYDEVAITQAASLGSFAMVKTLLDHGANPDTLNPSDGSLLMVLLKSVPKDSERELLDELITRVIAAVDVDHLNFADRNGDTALHIAVVNHPQYVQLLLDAGANPDACNRRGKSALHLACMQNNLAVVDCLLGVTTDINTADEYGSTPLKAAVSYAELSVVQLLLDRGLSLDLGADSSQSYLVDVMSAGNTTKCLGLIEMGANCNVSQEAFQSPLAAALSYDASREVWEALLQNGADVRWCNSSGTSTVIGCAISNYNFEFLEHVKGLGLISVADLTKPGVDVSYLDTAVQSISMHFDDGDGAENMIKYLLNYGAKFRQDSSKSYFQRLLQLDKVGLGGLNDDALEYLASEKLIAPRQLPRSHLFAQNTAGTNVVSEAKKEPAAGESQVTP